ncbi:hypothetical protein MKEN_00481700 [Mycena kentingensis (nom. inval.)]|nr:hypothetical protein MKEN_00481700 [Mycena kentingensis (nom. inval.)]
MSSPTATSHYLFFLPFARRQQRLLQVPSEGATVSHGDAQLRRSIIDIVNREWDEGIAPGMQVIPGLIAPGNTVLRLRTSTETTRHVKQTPVLLAWLRADEIMSFEVKNAAYAVAFAIPSSPGYHLLDLAWLLLCFQDEYIRESDYNRFNLVRDAHILGPDKCLAARRGYKWVEMEPRKPRRTASPSRSEACDDLSGVAFMLYIMPTPRLAVCTPISAKRNLDALRSRGPPYSSRALWMCHRG